VLQLLDFLLGLIVIYISKGLTNLTSNYRGYPFPGKDKYVVLWSIHDHISTLGGGDSTNPSGAAGSIVKSADNASLGPRGIFQGHADTVEDVQFCPTR